MVTLFGLRHPVTILVTDFTSPKKFTKLTVPLCYCIEHLSKVRSNKVWQLNQSSVLHFKLYRNFQFIGGFEAILPSAELGRWVMTDN